MVVPLYGPGYAVVCTPLFINVIQAKVRDKCMYIEKTGRSLKQRFKEHQTQPNSAVAEHIRLTGHQFVVEPKSWPQKTIGTRERSKRL